MKNSSDRLRLIRKSRGFSQEAFSGSLGISLRSYQNYESGKHPIPSDLLRELAETGVNIHWLLTGSGEMFNPLQVVVAKINSMIKQKEATEQLLVANLELARTEVAARFGEKAAAEIFKGPMMPEETPRIDEG